MRVHNKLSVLVMCPERGERGELLNDSSLLFLGDSLVRRNQDLLYASSAGSAPSPNVMINSAEISIMAQQSRLRKHVGGQS